MIQDTKNLAILKKFYKKGQLKRVIYLLLLIFFGLCSVAFIVTSFGKIDLYLNEVSEILMYIKFFQIWQMLMEEFGYFFPIWIGFFLMTIWIESYSIRLKEGNLESTKFNKIMKKIFVYFIWTFYIVFIIVRIFMFKANYISKKNLDMGWGVGNDVKSQLSMSYRIIATIVFYSIEVILTLSIIIWFKISSMKTKRFLRTNVWYQGAKVGMFFIMSYVMIWIFKHFFGRPYYFSVVYNRMYFEMLGFGWVPSTSGKIWMWPTLNNAPEFTPWYVPNNLIENLKYWFIKKPIYENPNADQYWNMDFPSGHTTAMSILVSLISLFWNDNRLYVKKWVFNLIFTTVIVGWLIMMFTMVYSRFHWASDVFFSSAFAFLAWKWASRIIELICLPFIMKVHKKKQISSNFAFLVVHKNKRNASFAYYFNSKVIKIKRIKNFRENERLIEDWRKKIGVKECCKIYWHELKYNIVYENITALTR